MADTRPTPANPLRALSLCAKVIFAPHQMAAEDEKDDELRKLMPERPDTQDHSAFAVRKALFSSFALVVSSGAIGYALGQVMSGLGRCALPSTVSWLQICGSSLLLWGTLFIRGWEVQTYGGVSPTERVNQWIYRALYCTGTAVLVYSLGFVPCKQ